MDYITELSEVLDSIGREIETHNQSQSGQEQQEILQNIEDDEYHAKQILDNITSEMRHLNYNEKTKLQTQLEPLTTKYKALQHTLTVLRKPAMPSNGSGGSGGPGFSRQEKEQWKDERQRLLGANAVVTDTSQSLARTAEYIEQSTDIGIATTQTLENQRSQIVGWHEQIRETDAQLTTSRRILERMRRRVVTNKLIMYAAIGVELVIIVLIVYFKYYG